MPNLPMMRAAITSARQNSALKDVVDISIIVKGKPLEEQSPELSSISVTSAKKGKKQAPDKNEIQLRRRGTSKSRHGTPNVNGITLTVKTTCSTVEQRDQIAQAFMDCFAIYQTLSAWSFFSPSSWPFFRSTAIKRNVHSFEEAHAALKAAYPSQKSKGENKDDEITAMLKENDKIAAMLKLQKALSQATGDRPFSAEVQVEKNQETDYQIQFLNAMAKGFHKPCQSYVPGQSETVAAKVKDLQAKVVETANELKAQMARFESAKETKEREVKASIQEKDEIIKRQKLNEERLNASITQLRQSQDKAKKVADENIQELKSSIEEKNRELERVNKKLLELSERQHSLNLEGQKIKAELKEAKEKAESQTLTIQGLQQEVDSGRAKIASEKKETEKFKKLTSELVTTGRNLQDMNLTLRRTVSEQTEQIKAQAVQLAAPHHERMKQIEAENTDLKAEHTKLTKEISVLIKRNTEQQTEITEQQKEIVEQRKIISSYQSIIQSLMTFANDLVEKLVIFFDPKKGSASLRGFVQDQLPTIWEKKQAEIKGLGLNIFGLMSPSSPTASSDPRAKPVSDASSALRRIS